MSGSCKLLVRSAPAGYFPAVADDRAMRTAADVLRLALIAGAPLMYTSGRTHAAASLAIIGAAALALRAAKAPAGLDLAFLAALSLDAWLTALGAFDGANREDRAGHLVLTALVTPVLVHGARRHGLAAAGRPAVAVALGFALGVAWELVELTADATLGTDMSLGAADTAGDLVADLLGAGLGALALRWWPTRP